MRRIAASSTAALLILTGLTACTPEIKGVTGLTVDTDGRLLAALAWCADRPPDVVILFAERDGVSPAPSGVSASTVNWPDWPGREYDVPRGSTSPATVHLAGFPPEPVPDPHATFRTYGVAGNSSFTSVSVTFRLAELSGLEPGSILITTTEAGEEVQQEVSLDEFARLGKDAC
ncbi:hypothetical protein Pen02_51600 [Plantactinospora endophytica]|uniref:GerMN domain-containing protein n=1 Tax=Plantactinospora endophytica TaxID=673535 RepID=A0ABQ4E685_9ACTN|nr:hypothetical protein Pen02_51600 [Plantactinospora endophytica]